MGAPTTKRNFIALSACICAALIAACSSTPPAPSFIPLTDEAALARGKTSYETRCMGCHQPATPGAPDRTALNAMTPARIYTALTTGKMKLMTLDMPDAEAREIASYLGKK